MAARRIRWGILGAGRIAGSFARDLGWVENAELAAIASRDAARAAEFARTHGCARHYASYPALFADSAIDAVYIATPHSEHLSQATAALRAGKAVLCEKPLTLNTAECRALLAVARETGGYLLEGMWTWFLPAIQQAMAWVQAGRIGRLRHVQADFGYPQLPFDAQRREYAAELGGGCLLELGVYPVAFSHLFQTGDPHSVQVTARRAPNGVEDDLVAVLEFPDATSTLASSFRCKLRNWAYVIGEEGYIAIPDFWRASEAMHFRLDECVEHFRDGRASLGFDYEARAVGEDMRAGRRESAVVTHAHSLKFAEHVERLRRAMRRSFEPGNLEN